jgi:hypothetical protein
MFKKIPYEQNNLTELAAEQIEEAKRQFGDVYHIKVDEMQCFIHKPTRAVIDLAISSSAKRSSMFDETILRNCWLAGNKEMVEVDDYFFAARGQLDEVIKFKTAELKKL